MPFRSHLPTLLPRRRVPSLILTASFSLCIMAWRVKGKPVKTSFQQEFVYDSIVLNRKDVSRNSPKGFYLGIIFLPYFQDPDKCNCPPYFRDPSQFTAGLQNPYCSRARKISSGMLAYMTFTTQLMDPSVAIHRQPLIWHRKNQNAAMHDWPFFD